LQIQIATITAKGPVIEEPYELTTDWSAGFFKYPQDVKIGSYVSTTDNNNNNRGISLTTQ
jgi:hypothetical protein